MIKTGKNCCVLNGTFDEIYVRNWQCDTEMSDDSPRPVQNKVIKKYVDERLEAISANLDSMDKTLDQVTDLEHQVLLLVYMIQMGIYNKIYILNIILELLQFIQIIKSMETFVLLKLEFHNLFTKKLFQNHLTNQ